jgi:hypothetical protein
MASGAEYRQYAVDYVALVERASDPDEKARLVSMAQAFLTSLLKQSEAISPSGKD